MMKTRREYSVLPQSERRNQSGEKNSVSKWGKCCFVILILLSVIVVIGIISAACVRLAYPQFFRTAWGKLNIGDGYGVNETTIAPTTNVSSETVEETSTKESSVETSSGSEVATSPVSMQLNDTLSVEVPNATYEDKEGYYKQKLQDLEQQFASFVRNTNDRWKNLTGIRQDEFAIPLLMLLCFLSVWLLVTILCCLACRRREKNRRELYGKLMTDLQNEDSKAVLLGNQESDN